MLLYQQLGGYRWQGAAATALVLLVLVVLVFVLLGWLTRRPPRYPWNRHTREERHARVS